MSSRRTSLIAATIAAILLPAAAALAQHDSGGSTGHGDLFGDLVHIRRDATTGQAILERRRVLLPQDVYGWAYCPVPVTLTGASIPLAPDSCDVHPDFVDAVVEVSYFGRLSAGRTRERNLRMHFDEVIAKIRDAQAVTRDEAGRLKLGTGCAVVAEGPVFTSCTTWSVVDSPVENLALYHRLIKYGHLQTDPLEVDASAHGDPALPTQYHVALRAEDWAKFAEPLRKLLPIAPGNAGAAAACFADVAACVAPRVLQVADFSIAASFLGTGADKHGTATIDLVQYLHRLLRVTCGNTEATRGWCATPTETAFNPLNSIPALVRDCYDLTGQLTTTCRTYPADVPVVTSEGTVVAAASGFPANERFVNYGAIVRSENPTPKPASYDRAEWFGVTLPVLQPTPGTMGQTWTVAPVALTDWLALANPGEASGRNAAALVNATQDAIRCIQFIHEYEVPADLGYFPY